MQDRITLPDWDALADLEDEALPLLPTALLIARDEYPDLQPSTYDALIQSHVDHLRSEVDSIDNSPLKMAAINRHLFDELGYSGDHDEYYDPRNSYLNDVMDRKTGIPISLSVLYWRLAARLGHALLRDARFRFGLGRGQPVERLVAREHVDPGGLPPFQRARRCLVPVENLLSPHRVY